MNKVYLAHHGIFGQKWGRRRYQNKDGSLTPAGELRYNKGTSDSNPDHDALMNKYTKMLGKKRANRVVKRIEKGESPKKAVRREAQKSVAKLIVGSTLAGIGAAVITDPRIAVSAAEKGKKIVKGLGNVWQSQYKMTVIDSAGNTIKKYRHGVRDVTDVVKGIATGR